MMKKVHFAQKLWKFRRIRAVLKNSGKSKNYFHKMGGNNKLELVVKKKRSLENDPLPTIRYMIVSQSYSKRIKIVPKSYQKGSNKKSGEIVLWIKKTAWKVIHIKLQGYINRFPEKNADLKKGEIWEKSYHSFNIGRIAVNCVYMRIPLYGICCVLSR